ncbi:hypothetical protein BOX15_Mlig011712g4 [Macrostomum lignano]|uniref:PCI domain-containing protein n=1 Tax=Macrostomum lignano TaxID=282301 RepID=A0A267DYD5_9PLAT|nr:hypothetical protein BOX15_Mlig011712g4 [Macrostomum lignano]
MVEPMVVDILNDVEQNENVQPAAGAIVQNANLDLDLIVSSYTGYARYQRLIYIADHCPPLRVQALTMTLNYLKSETLDVQAYVECHRKLVASAPAGQAPAQDTQWVEATRKLAQLSLEKLDVELRSSKQSAIKESIRRGQDELAFHFLRMGDLSSALKNYSRTREYCTNHLQELDMCLNVIRISVYSCNWQHAKSHITKAEACSGVEVGRSLGAGGYPGDASALTSAAPSSKPKEREGVQRKLAFVQAASGLVELADSRYRTAARQFLAVQFDFFNCPELLSPANIATYASLCALATFDRQDMRRLVMSSANFRQFLEVEPAVRDVVTSFHQANYAACLAGMERLKPTLLLDLYLGSHVESLFSEIRKRALTQYFSPYVSADLDKMASTFGTSVPALEDELMRLILDKRIAARIDSNKRLLVAKQADLRSAVFESALQACRDWKRRNSAAILHLAVSKANLCVTESNPASGAASAAASAGGAASAGAGAAATAAAGACDDAMQ